MGQTKRRIRWKAPPDPRRDSTKIELYSFFKESMIQRSSISMAAAIRPTPFHVCMDLPWEERVKYMIEYTIRNSGLTHEQNMAGEEALLNAFGKWRPEDGLNVQAFLSNLGNGGYVLVEASDPKIVYSFVAKFNYWNDVDVVPVIDVQEAVELARPALAWARSSSKG
jgi:hypothetical protein